MTALMRRFRRIGGSVTPTRRGHWRWSLPGMIGCVVSSGSPSRRHAVNELRRDLKRFLGVSL
jgi:hypothetical protein